uniref:Uncharacterized protein n=1 Tax=Myoviridae sp. ctGRa7 TaxID=2826633 RepID=A0A8S5N0K0_9CAUD|nr:MAG TPA: hypothetical protein [Myoviridae sp. ctGRa7]
MQAVIRGRRTFDPPSSVGRICAPAGAEGCGCGRVFWGTRAALAWSSIFVTQKTRPQ